MQTTGLTTPDPVCLQQALRGFADQGVVACAMEASSIGIVENRLAGAHIRVAAFTNFTQDHLDYHGSMAAYWAAKRALFNWPGLRAVVINIDDAQGAELARELAAQAPAPGEGTPALELWTVSLHQGLHEGPHEGPHQSTRLQGCGLRHTATGLAFEVTEGDQRVAVHSPFFGDFNASNLLVVLGCLRALGHPLAPAVQALQTLQAVPGRLMPVPAAANKPLVLVDYAHTPDALDKVLRTLKPLAQARGGALWCLFGCGGDRDATKRPLMGAIAAAQADHVMLTSDNPRSEAPAAILAQILAGTTGVARAEPVGVIEDRAAAVADVLARATPNDVVLLAGKGHEDYQEVQGVRRPFSDLAWAQALLQ
jgi:MurE/MurF fusion protein